MSHTQDLMSENSLSLSILVIDEDPIRASIIEAGLKEAGHLDVRIVSQMARLVRRIEEIEPDVIVIDLENPNRDLLEHLFQVSRAVRKPVAMFVDQSETGMMEAAIEAGVSAYVVDGLRKDRVKPILDMAVARFRAYSRLRDELDATKQALADRKILDQAKSVLMRSRSISEDEAHHMIRRTAMQESRRMVDVARSIVTTAHLILGDST
jgi:two-component system, response regulator / RNA-binding antiterminator